LERTARQLASYQRCVVSLRLCVAGGQPLNSSVRRFLLKKPNSKMARLKTEDAPRKIKVARVADGVLKMETRLTSRWT